MVMDDFEAWLTEVSKRHREVVVKRADKNGALDYLGAFLLNTFVSIGVTRWAFNGSLLLATTLKRMSSPTNSRSCSTAQL